MRINIIICINESNIFSTTFCNPKISGRCLSSILFRINHHFFWKTLLIFVAVFACSVFLSISPVIYVLAAAIAGIIVKELEARKS